MEGAPPTEQEPLGDLEAMQLFDAILIYAQEAVVSDEEAVDFLATQIEEMKRAENSKTITHYLDRLDPDQYDSETKRLSENAKERLRKAFAKNINESQP
jgi:hypothetical protein